MLRAYLVEIVLFQTAIAELISTSDQFDSGVFRKANRTFVSDHIQNIVHFIVHA